MSWCTWWKQIYRCNNRHQIARVFGFTPDIFCILWSTYIGQSHEGAWCPKCRRNDVGADQFTFLTKSPMILVFKADRTDLDTGGELNVGIMINGEIDLSSLRHSYINKDHMEYLEYQSCDSPSFTGWKTLYLGCNFKSFKVNKHDFLKVFQGSGIGKIPRTCPSRSFIWTPRFENVLYKRI